MSVDIPHMDIGSVASVSPLINAYIVFHVVLLHNEFNYVKDSGGQVWSSLMFLHNGGQQVDTFVQKIQKKNLYSQRKCPVWSSLVFIFLVKQSFF